MSKAVAFLGCASASPSSTCWLAVGTGHVQVRAGVFLFFERRSRVVGVFAFFAREFLVFREHFFRLSAADCPIAVWSPGGFSLLPDVEMHRAYHP